MKVKYLAVALTLAVASSFSGNTLPVKAATGNDNVDLTHELDVEELSPTELVITNPNTEGFTVVPEENTTSISSFIVPSVSDTIYNGCEEATSAIRSLMANRVGNFSVSCYSDSSSGAFDMRDYLQAHLFDETSSSKEGDYLYWNLHKYSIQFNIARSGDRYIVTSEVEVEYLSNAAQEQEIDNIVATALSSKGAVGSQGAKNKYEQVKAIYKFICDDFEYVMGDDNHSTYSALGRHQTVCQGYATSLYRLCRDSGISSRVIASQTHGWNIVQLGSLYYLCDATWEDTDNVDGYNEYFLKGTSTFPSDSAHESLNNYTNVSFTSAHPIDVNDYVYNDSTTEETTTEETTMEEATTEDTTSEITTEGTDTTEPPVTTEEVTTESYTTEQPTTTESDVIYEDDYLSITKETGEASEDETYTPAETPSTEEWTTPQHSGDNKYEIEGEQHVSPQKPSHSGGNHSNNGTGNTTSPSGKTESATTENTTTENTTEGTTDAPDTISVAIKVNGESLDESLEWEDDNLTSIRIAGLHNVKISCYAAGKELTGDSELEANDNIEAIKISADEDLSYAVKTKQFGWLDFTKDEYAGSLGTDDYLVGIKFKFDSVEDDDCTALVGKVDTTNCKHSKLTFKLFTDKWSDKLPNGAISDNKDGINAIRISADGITYSVRTDKWLPEVSSGVLAGDIYGDNYVTGLKISDQDIMFRVKTADGLWSDWYSSGDSVVNENAYIIDVQIYQK